MKYETIIRKLRFCADGDYWDSCDGCEYNGMERGTCLDALMNEAADAIEELFKAASAMHEWIFLNTGDEQAAYNECGLSADMNAALGYGGQFVVNTKTDEKEEIDTND